MKMITKMKKTKMGNENQKWEIKKMGELNKWKHKMKN